MGLIAPILRAYLSLFNQGNWTAILFTVLSVVQLRQTFQVAQSLRSQAAFTLPPLTPAKKHLLDEAAVYIAGPISILLHELGHAVAVWASGGHVLEFGFFVFWGYVLPDRSFSPVTQWIISSAGTWMNLALALGVWLTWRRRPSPVYRYAALRIARFQLIFALIMYPIFTALLAFGDWRVIYDFGRTPLLSGLTAGVHLAVLAGFWLADRRGFFELSGFATAEAETQAEHLAADWERRPDDLSTGLELLATMIQGGSQRRALHLARKLAARWPDSARVFYFLGMLQTRADGRPSAAGLRDLQRALDNGLSNPFYLTSTYRALALYELERGHSEAALRHLDEAIRQAAALPPEVPTHNLHYWRSVVYRRQQQMTLAYQELQYAAAQAAAQGAQETAAYYQDQLKALHPSER